MELGSHVVDLPAGLAAVPPHLALAAHLRVQGALSGDPAVLTGYVPQVGGAPLGRRVVLAEQSWEELAGAAVVERDRGFPHVFDHGPLPAPDLSGDVALWVCLGDRLRLDYRTDVYGYDQIHRMAGYYLTALRAAVEAPSEVHDLRSLLTPEELRFQVEVLAGPVVEVPWQGFAELFEAQVERVPDDVAVVCGTRRWTYAQLDRRANGIAHALLDRGLRAGDVVAVVLERDLEWAACVVALLKTGLVYLPVEPGFPAERVAFMTSRAGAALVITEPRHTAVAGVDAPVAFVGELDGDPAAPGVVVGPDQAAYIYFTSGSTGEPKGAVCEHAGMVNHLFAKIEDLGVRAGDTVAQVASQCFDISLWQLVSAWLVGGRTLIVEQPVVLDVDRFAALVGAEVDILQVVPSYLELLLHKGSVLDRPRRVSVTGEPLKAGLAHRWFAAYPDKALVNAYGLTETCDDTNHEVMHAPPDGPVSLGRPVRNVRIAVVDRHLNRVPFGAPGEIVFSGVCVGRGYVNDPERTRLAFLPDPEHPGGRRYRSGDFGRWSPDGKLEFLGRRDAQTKIRGFRVELGEVENHLLRIPSVRDAAVVVVDQTLVAFHTGDAVDVRAALADALPDYMVPSRVHRLDALPLTHNGKVDKRALVEPADAVVAAPTTPTERWITGAWAEVLGVPVESVGRDDDFFARGTSLSAVRLVLKLDRVVTHEDVAKHPVLADLAALVDARRTS
ncbi:MULTISPECIES: non-ribosomal peptide synthetase [unclassified Saccharothrix]|uniref:non-ribosomal peptide synthetase n=1 Tax=unclassified Saccharothrix TaxID=2593673 RepID=UPI00307F82D5